MNLVVMILKTILKILELMINTKSTDDDKNTTSTINDNNTSNAVPPSIKMDQSARLEQMWEVYNRVIKMKEEQARSDAEEIVKLRFKIEDLQDELARERRLNDELRKKMNKVERNESKENSNEAEDPPNNTEC